uniref:Uncharacterized protein n=1 Tax=Arundo donax TaxID=35708 RepID=A0A0A9B692_ARUDO
MAWTQLACFFLGKATASGKHG